MASDIEVTDDGRVFGIIARSYYKDGKDNEQPGEVYELKNNKWEKIDLLSNEVSKNVKCPRDIYYHNGTLYICSTCTPLYGNFKDGLDFHNFGGGIITYKDGKINQIFDESISVAGVQIDTKGTLYASDINGNIYRKAYDSEEYKKIYDSYHSISKGIQLFDDDVLYLSAFGGGVLKLENLNSLYEHKSSDFDFNISLIPNTEIVNNGDKITVRVKVSDFINGNEIIALSGKLEFDKNKLELEKVTGLNSCEFSEADYNLDNFRFVTTANEFIKTETEIFEVVFKVKENAEIGETTIKLTSIVGGSGKINGTLYAEDTSSNIKIEKKYLGDVDLNGEITINDLAKIKLHLIEKEILTDAATLKMADLDEDGEITINDLALLKLILIGLK